MKDLLLELSLEIMEKYNIDKITIEATKFVAKELTKRLKYKKVLVNGKRGFIFSVCNSGLNLIVYISNEKNNSFIDYTDFDQIILLDQ